MTGTISMGSSSIVSVLSLSYWETEYCWYFWSLTHSY